LTAACEAAPARGIAAGENGPVQAGTMTGRATVRLWRLPGVGRGPGELVARCVGFSKTAAVPMQRRELPSRNITLIINFGDALVVVDNDQRRRSLGSFVSGIQSESALTERVGHQHGMHVELNPLAAYSVFGLPMHSLADTVVDLASVLGPAGEELVEHLAGAGGWSERFAVLRKTLVARMTSGPQPTAVVGWAWDRLVATNGSLRIGDLVRQTGVSHRHLATRFREEIGVTPKGLARVLRFEHSLRMLQATETPLAQVAAAAGYYDQAHFNRDFREMAGCTPGAMSHARSALIAPTASGQVSPRPPR
jgi:AraC-like DNA-binding protein